ncbi:MAG: NAD(P)H-hydrate epimerase [Planctomycetota bacterium]|nr:NAD(P)H-hydrate epimerase [Planctomycetota bacterium]
MDGAHPGTLSRDQVRRLDRLAIDELGIPGVVLMENAGRGAADALREAVAAGELATKASAPRVFVLCGAGNNGGDGYVIARHLACAGWPVEIGEAWCGKEPTSDSAVFRAVTRAMQLRHHVLGDAAAWSALEPSLGGVEVLVDAFLGTGARGEVREPLAGIMAAAGAWTSREGCAVVAVDSPSGLDVDTGRAAAVTLPAALTLTFVAPKAGFEAARDWVGRVRVLSIGTPPDLERRVRQESLRSGASPG